MTVTRLAGVATGQTVLLGESRDLQQLRPGGCRQDTDGMGDPCLTEMLCPSPRGRLTSPPLSLPVERRT